MSFTTSLDNKIDTSYQEVVIASNNEYSSEEQRQIVESFDEKKISRLRLKIDFNLIPACSLLYLLCFLDRGNIGNAKIAGMAADLNLSADDYSVILVVFFATYCTLEAPTNMLLKKMSPKLFLPLICILWGICVLGMGFARSKHDLIALRVLLGIFEAGLMPGCAYYLSTGTAVLNFRIALPSSFRLLPLLAPFLVSLPGPS